MNNLDLENSLIGSNNMNNMNNMMGNSNENPMMMNLMNMNNNSMIGNNMMMGHNIMMNEMNNNMINQMNNNINNNEMRGNMMMNPMQMMNQMNNNNEMMGNNNNIGMSMNMMNQTTNIMMDDNAVRIKNIIKPYEEKIKELEETIRKNYLKIAILNDKLNQNNNNNNQMLMMNNNMINNNDMDIIELVFENMFIMNSNPKIKCLNDELMESVINRYCRKNFCDKNNFDFYYMNNLINMNDTASESGLMNGSIIIVQKKPQMFQMNLNMMNNLSMDNLGMNNLGMNNLGMNNLGMNNMDMNNLGMNNLGMNNMNINFNNNINNNTERRINLIFSYKGEKIIVFLGESSSIKEGLKSFITKKNITDDNAKNLTFLYNNKKLLLNDERQLKEVFVTGFAHITVL